MFAKGIDLPVTDIIGWRSLCAAFVLLVYLVVCKKQVLPSSIKHYGLMLILGGLLCAHWLTYFQALKVSTAAVAILSLHTYPVLTALIEPFLFGERLRKTDMVLAA